MKYFQKLMMAGLVVTFFLLSGCASRVGAPAGITDANAMNSGDKGGAQTYALTKEDNLIETQLGPHQGLLGKRSFYFAFDSNEVKSEDYASLQAQGEYLVKHPDAKVRLEGNTDERGSREYNIALGQRRANAVSAILKEAGAKNNQIRTLSYGAERPIALGHTESDYQLNRRVDLIYEKD